MATWMVFARTEYAEPLEHVRDVEADGPPSVEDAAGGREWLELTVVPADAVIWIERDGETVRESATA